VYIVGRLRSLYTLAFAWKHLPGDENYSIETQKCTVKAIVGRICCKVLEVLES
jgi:hypothetical protein